MAYETLAVPDEQLAEVCDVVMTGVNMLAPSLTERTIDLLTDWVNEELTYLEAMKDIDQRVQEDLLSDD